MAGPSDQLTPVDRVGASPRTPRRRPGCAAAADADGHLQGVPGAASPAVPAALLPRRGLLRGALALPPLALVAPALLPGRARAAGAGVAVPGAPDGWTAARFSEAMRRSGRPIEQSDAEFAAIQARRPDYLRRIEGYLKERLGSADPAVMRAFATVPRDYFHYQYADRRPEPGVAYEADAKPWALGYGSALSDYLGQAYMTQVCQPKPGETTLEVGTGSGFQSSILSRIVRRAYTIEIIEPLGHAVDRIFAPLGYDNVEGRVGDGYFGWPEVKDGFDVIIVTCAAQYAPPDLFRQLKPGGRMVIPIGQPFKRGQVLYIYTKDAEGKVHSRRDVGVFFIPMTGAMMNRPRPADGPAPAATTASTPRAGEPPVVVSAEPARPAAAPTAPAPTAPAAAPSPTARP